MEGLLEFFSNLILFTAGVVVSLIWLVLIVAICIEIKDTITGEGEDKGEEL